MKNSSYHEEISVRQSTLQKRPVPSVSKMWFRPVLQLWSPVLFLSVLPLTGCSGDRQQVVDQGKIKACSLVTQAEMAEITGRPMKSPEEKTNGAASTCTYVSSDEAGKGGGAPLISFALLASSSENSDADAAYSHYVADLKKSEYGND